MYANATPIRWASGLTMLVGAWLALSPIFMSVSGTPFWVQVIAGAALFVLGGTQMFVESTLPSWVNGLIGVALVFTPIIYAVSTGIFWSELLAGVATIFLAAYDGYEVATNKALPTYA